MALSDLPKLPRLTRGALGAFSFSAPSWATPWRAGAWRSAARRASEDAARTGPSVAVLGNCQGRGVAQAIRLLAPGSPVRFLPMASLRRDHGTLDGLTRVLAGHDHVFAQAFPGGLLPDGDIAALCTREPRVRQFPTVVFSAFHPDMVYAGRTLDLAGQRLAASPLGQYHSAIALCAHRLGLDVAETASLFRADVFRHLGYFDHWEPSARELLAMARSQNFPLDHEMNRWARRGAFMHVFNHPKAHVTGDIARRLLVESGFTPEPVQVEDYLGDDLARDVIWPVYPEIAEAFGLEGSYLFKAKGRGDEFPRLYDLHAFLEASFALYDACAPGDLACARIDLWAGSPWIADVFRAAKGSGARGSGGRGARRG